MGHTPENIDFADLTRIKNYNINSLEAEIRADRCCALLLKAFHRWVLDERQLEALEAGRMAAGADYFLRDFLIGAKRQNIFRATAEDIRQFAGNWYIISNLEPNIPELEPMLRGASLFYAYALHLNLVKPDTADELAQATSQIDFFKQRIDDFHALQDDGYRAWDQACPYK